MVAQETYVIVGSGLAGAQAAQTLRAEGFEGQILLVGDEPHLPYDRPPLSKDVLEGTMSAESTTLRSAGDWEELNIELLVGVAVTEIDPDTGEVTFAGHPPVVADRILLATGARARSVGLEGEALAGVHTLRTFDDAVALHDALTDAESVVVIGAGFIGLEVAAAARRIGCQVTVLECDQAVLGRVLPTEIGDRLAEIHRQHGVVIQTSSVVARLVGEEHVTGVETATGETIPADLVIVGVGAVPNTELAESAGLAVDNGVVVDEFCQTSSAIVFAAGDVANFPSTSTGTRVRRECWQNALDQGAAAAKSMLGKGAVYEETPWFWSKQYDFTLQMAGGPRSDHDVVWRGDLQDPSFAAFYLADGVVQGAIGLNRPKELRASLDLIRRGIQVPEDVLRDPDIDIRKATRPEKAAKTS